MSTLDVVLLDVIELLGDELGVEPIEEKLKPQTRIDRAYTAANLTVAEPIENFNNQTILSELIASAEASDLEVKIFVLGN